MNLNNRREIWLTAAFWLLLLIVIISLLSQVAPLSDVLLFSIKTVLLFMAMVELNNRLLIPKFFRKGQFTWFAILISGLILMTAWGQVYTNQIWFENLLPGPPRNLLVFKLGYDEVTFLGVPIFRMVPFVFLSMAILFVTTAYQLAKTLLEKEKQQSALEREKVQHELNFLRSQINPHFLFNALNNLHATVQLYPDQAGEFVMKLADMLHYVLEDCKKEKVLLKDEIAYIRNYIFFQQQKDRAFSNVRFEIHGSNVEQFEVEPMLFIALVENAFVHSYLKDSSQRFIDLQLSIRKDGRLFFSARNNLGLSAKQRLGNSNGQGHGQHGVGLNNIKRRLELCYPDKHHLSYWMEGGEFVAEMSLERI